MERSAFFTEFNRVMPGLIISLAKVAKKQHSKAGEVIFRQGDPGVDCYSVIDGQVGVFISKDKQTSPRDLESAREAQRAASTISLPVIKPPEIPWKKLLRRLCFCRKRKDEGTVEVTPVQVYKPTKATRYLTYEGHNTYNADSRLGNQVVALGKDVVFGEIALLEDKPRAATIKCLKNCTFLVIQKKDFLHMFGNSLNKGKMTLFVNKVPGFQEWAGANQLKTVKTKDGRRVVTMGSHPSDVFRKETARIGHYFLKEGEIAEPEIFVLESGEVEYRKLSYEFPRMTPLRATACWETPARPAVLKPLKEQKPLRRIDTIWHRLGPGSIFCSLDVFQLPCAEPFSVVASKNCELYRATGSDVLKLPEGIQLAIKRHMVDNYRPLLWQSPGFNSFVGLVAPPTWGLADFDDEEMLV